MKNLLAAFALAALATVSAPREAHAQFRANAAIGVEQLRRDGSDVTMLQLRAEASLRTAAWLDVGAYVQHLERLDRAGSGAGWGLGAMVTLRPAPQSVWGPVAFGSLGYQRAPEGAIYHDGFFAELGGGIAYRPAPIVDLELRGGFVGLLGGQRDLTGFTAGVALSLHP